MASIDQARLAAELFGAIAYVAEVTITELIGRPFEYGGSNIWNAISYSETYCWDGLTPPLVFCS